MHASAHRTSVYSLIRTCVCVHACVCMHVYMCVCDRVFFVFDDLLLLVFSFFFFFYKHNTHQRSPALQSRLQTHHHHLSLIHEGRWGTTDDFTTSFLHFSLFFTAFWDMANSRPVHSLMLSFHLCFHLPCLLSLSL